MQKPEPTPVYELSQICRFLADFLNETCDEWRENPNVGGKDCCEVERQLIGANPDRSELGVKQFWKKDLEGETNVPKSRLLLHEIFGSELWINTDW